MDIKDDQITEIRMTEATTLKLIVGQRHLLIHVDDQGRLQCHSGGRGGQPDLVVIPYATNHVGLRFDDR